jgi:hypothetical protein
MQVANELLKDEEYNDFTEGHLYSKKEHK